MGQLPNNATINIKVPLPDMIKIVEDSVKEFNVKQRSSETIRKTFRKVYQDPWHESVDEFNAHLDSLEKDSMYKTLLDNQTALDISN